jgi:hypothetical protein
VALGVEDGGVTPETVRSAFLELTKRFHPARFGRMATDIQRNANEVFLGIKAAHELLLRSLGVSGRGAPRAQSSGMPVLAAEGSNRTARPGTPPGAAGARGPTQPMPRPAGVAVPRTLTPTKPGVNVPTGATPAFGIRAQPLARRGTPPQRQGTPPQTRPQDRPSTPRMVPPAPAAQDPLTTRGTGEWAQKTAPVFDERIELQQVMDALAQKNWGAAKALLNGLAVRVPASKQYRALLAYTRGREAQGAGRGEDAVMEFQRALQLDPDLQQAKSAMAELLRRR